jgi:hypothetical protein
VLIRGAVGGEMCADTQLCVATSLLRSRSLPTLAIIEKKLREHSDLLLISDILIIRGIIADLIDV